jgi:hypothetical protein
MTPSLKRGRIEQKTKVLQLLTLSGAVRDANIEARYRGSETVLAVATSQQPEMPRHEDSIWWMDLTAVWKTLQARQSALPFTSKDPRNTRTVSSQHG